MMQCSQNKCCIRNQLVGTLVKVCEILYDKRPNMFYAVVMTPNMQRRYKGYFVEDDMKLALKNMVDGRRIADSKLHVETNHNSEEICEVIMKILKDYNIPFANMKIYLHPIEAENLQQNDEKIFVSGKYRWQRK